MYFCEAKRPELQKEGLSASATLQKLGVMWQDLSDEDKKVST